MPSTPMPTTHSCSPIPGHGTNCSVWDTAIILALSAHQQRENSPCCQNFLPQMEIQRELQTEPSLTPLAQREHCSFLYSCVTTNLPCSESMSKVLCTLHHSSHHIQAPNWLIASINPTKKTYATAIQFRPHLLTQGFDLTNILSEVQPLGRCNEHQHHLAFHLHQKLLKYNDVVELQVCKAEVSEPNTLSYNEAPTGFYTKLKSFWSCSHINCCLYYMLHINLHILYTYFIKMNLNLKEFQEFNKSFKSYQENKNIFLDELNFKLKLHSNLNIRSDFQENS